MHYVVVDSENRRRFSTTNFGIRKRHIRVVRTFIEHISASDAPVLPRRPVSGGIFQSWANLTAVKAHVSQLAIAETAQEGQTRLVFTLRDEGRDPSIDEAEKPSADGAQAPPNAGRAVVITGAAV
jgi:hypothetical protein